MEPGPGCIAGRVGLVVGRDRYYCPIGGRMKTVGGGEIELSHGIMWVPRGATRSHYRRPGQFNRVRGGPRVVQRRGFASCV